MKKRSNLPLEDFLATPAVPLSKSVKCAWLISWECSAPHKAASVEPKIIGFLDARLSLGTVTKILPVLYATCARFNDRERLELATSNHMKRLMKKDSWWGVRYGQDPWLFARHVDDLKVEQDIGQDALITWTESIFSRPDAPAIKVQKEERIRRST